MISLLAFIAAVLYLLTGWLGDWIYVFVGLMVGLIFRQYMFQERSSARQAPIEPDIMRCHPHSHFRAITQSVKKLRGPGDRGNAFAQHGRVFGGEHFADLSGDASIDRVRPMPSQAYEDRGTKDALGIVVLLLERFEGTDCASSSDTMPSGLESLDELLLPGGRTVPQGILGSLGDDFGTQEGFQLLCARSPDRGFDLLPGTSSREGALDGSHRIRSPKHGLRKLIGKASRE